MTHSDETRAVFSQNEAPDIPTHVSSLTRRDRSRMTDCDDDRD